jgi:disulfide bond formation protein DsbB
MISYLKSLAHSAWYWWLLALIAVSFESVALFYQYALNYGPCPLCIHVRIGVFGILLISIVALLLRNLLWWRISHLLNALILAWLGHRAYLLLGTERGFLYIECGVDPGLPTWAPLDQWFPLLFKVWESCGYTPLLPFGISMAEGLIVLCPLLLLTSLLMFGLSFAGPDRAR